MIYVVYHHRTRAKGEVRGLFRSLTSFGATRRAHTDAPLCVYLTYTYLILMTIISQRPLLVLQLRTSSIQRHAEHHARPCLVSAVPIKRLLMPARRQRKDSAAFGRPDRNSVAYVAKCVQVCRSFLIEMVVVCTLTRRFAYSQPIVRRVLLRL